MSELLAEARVLETVAQGVILEVIFRGSHEWTHGNAMQRCVDEALAVKGAIAGILFNLLEYRYVAGNDVTVLYIAALDRTTPVLRIRPVCIVATGKTRDSLYAWFTGAKIIHACKVDFADTVATGLKRLRAHLGD
jgi:hypothetical protein